MSLRLPVTVAVLLSALVLSSCGIAATHPVEGPPKGIPSHGVVEKTTADGSVMLLRGGAVFAVLTGDASGWVGDHVDVVARGQIMHDPERHDRAEVSYVGDAAKPRTYTNTGQHTQESGAVDGSIILLDDGSVWVVASSGRGHTHRWAEGSVVNVEPGPRGLYKLENPSSGTVVLAAYVGEK